MKIGLLGFVTDDANKGCEALTYSFIQLLKDTIKESLEIVCYVPVVGKCSRLAAYFDGIQVSDKRLKLKDIHFSAIKELCSCDFVFDVTCGDGFSDIYFPKQVMYTTLIKELVILSRTPLILLPQTYGPFADKKIERFAMHVIRKSARVYSRDQISTDYIQKHIKKNIQTVTDLAFLLPYQTAQKASGAPTNIGLNVSGLLWNGGFTDKNQFGLTVDYKLYIYGIIEGIHKMGYQIHLIPHVVENERDSIDGDVKVCMELKEKYDYLIMAPCFENPIEAKSYIAKMDVFSGARMHSTIGAVSAGVPVIPFSYSRKFEGLYESLDYPNLIHGKQENTAQAIKRTLMFVQNREELQENVNTAKKIIDAKMSTFRDDLCEILRGKENEK